MKFEIFCPVYNEEYMLPFMIKHYLRCLKGHSVKFNIYDNGSTDDTVKIAKKYECYIGVYETGGKINDNLLKEFKNNIWKKSIADFVIIIDCDEFIEVLPDKLKRCTIAKSKGYDMLGYLDHTPDTIENGIRHTPEDKTCVFNPNKITAINYEVGAHTCKPEGTLIYTAEPFKLFHMKAHSLNYMIGKFEESQKRLSSLNKEKGWGKHYEMTKQEITDFHTFRYSQKIKVR